MSQAPTQPPSTIPPQTPPAPTAGRPQTHGAPGPGGPPSVQRQFVNFAFYKLDPAFRRLDDHEKLQARSEFLKLFEKPRPGMICLTYSTVGLKADSDFVLW